MDVSHLVHLDVYQPTYHPEAQAKNPIFFGDRSDMRPGYQQKLYVLIRVRFFNLADHVFSKCKNGTTRLKKVM